MTVPINPDAILRIVDKYRNRRGSIIAILEDVQAEFSYLPKSALAMVARSTGHSLVDIYGVATFFSRFSLEPRGRHVASVCVGTACHVRGAPRVLDEFERKLGIEAGKTTEDGEFSLGTVNCLGACAVGPVAVIDGEYHRYVKRPEVSGIIEQYRCGNHQRPSDDATIFRVDVACTQCNRSLMNFEHLLDAHPMIHVTVSFGRAHGWLRLSSLWGDFRIESEHEIPPDTVLDFFCPKCHAELRTTRQCPRCEAAMIPLFVRGGGIMQLCSRRGCHEHALNIAADDVE